MTEKMSETLSMLNAHTDPNVRAAGAYIQDCHERRTKIMNLIQESLSQIRLDMKYLVFDLEATRRERDSLKNI